MHEFRWEGDGLLLKYSEAMDGVDIVRVNSEIFGDPRFDQLKYIIVDLSNVQDIDLGNHDVSATTSFAVRANPMNPYVKVAFIARNEELCRLIRDYIAASLERLPHSRQKLFADESSAQGWIASSDD